MAPTPAPDSGSDPTPDPSLAAKDPRSSRAFGAVADAYDRARPSYPDEAVTWLIGERPSRVLELGAGTGLLTEQLVTRGHQVVATDPSRQMLERLAARLPTTRRLAAEAEHLPLADRCVDVVVAAQSFHWFDLDAALPEIARVLRPGGVLAIVWNLRDERIPWVHRLGALIGTPEQLRDPVEPLDDTGMFETVERSTYRFWQKQTRDSLRDLVASRSRVATLSDAERDRVLDKVDALYDGYGRGHDGMLLPYTTHCFRTRTLPWASAQASTASTPPPADGPDDLGTDSLLIDFH